MKKNQKNESELLQLENNSQIQAPLWFHYRQAPAHSIYPIHDHAWGEFIYAYDGVMELNIGQKNYITPPPYGIWLPPHLSHSGTTRTVVSHGTLYIHESLCQNLSSEAGILLTSPLVTALFLHLKSQSESQDILNTQPEHLRILHVILDQLQLAQQIHSYLPGSDHPALKQILNYLHLNPADNRPLQELAQQINMTERTLARHCQSELGMSLNEWRQRLKVMKAMTMLTDHKTVENIALDLGYASSSAFICMFKRWMNITPDQFRKLNQR